MKPLLLTSLCLTLAAPLLATAAPTAVVVISSEVNEDARAELRDPAQPLKCLVQPGIFEEIGSIAASRETYPSAQQVAGAVQAALDPALHVAVSGGIESADLVILTHWGEISPRGPQIPVPSKPGGTISMMHALIMGRSVRPPFLSSSETADINSEAREDRYYLLVTAYDAKALADNRNIIVWQTRLSADSLRHSRTDIWPTLAAAGKSYFGRNLEKPVLEANVPVVKLDASIPAVEVISNEKIPTKRIIF